MPAACNDRSVNSGTIMKFSSLAPALTGAAMLSALPVWAQTDVITLPERAPDALTADPAPLALSDVSYSFGGWVKLNAMWSRYSDGDVATPSAGRDYFRPNSIPVTAADGPDSTHFDAHAKDTRIWFLSNASLGALAVGTRLEMDFRLSDQGNEIVSNSYSPRLRRAFVTIGPWLVGQEWTLLRNHSGNPESLDSLGATDGLIFARQPQVRYTHGAWQVSLESNETFLLHQGVRQVTGDVLIPDLHLRHNVKGGWGDVSVSAVIRHLAADGHGSGEVTADDSAVGWGLSFGGKLKFGNGDDLRFMLTAGEGIGSYLAIATSTDAVTDDGGRLHPIPVANGAIGYRHLWNRRWRSTVAVSGLLVDNDTALTGTGLTRSVYSARANLIYEPVAKLLVGFELLQAVRNLENGLDGEHTRPQFSLKYSF